MGALQRRKGQVYERRLAKCLREVMPGADIARGLQSQGERVPDVDVLGLWIEAKNARAVTLDSALDQAIAAAEGTGRIPIAIVHRPGSRYAQDQAHLLLSDFLELAGLDQCGEANIDSIRLTTTLDRLLLLIGRWWVRSTY